MSLNASFRTNNLIERIHFKAMKVAERYRQSEIELIEILDQVDRHRVYYKYGSSSLFKYATEQLGLSHEVSYIFINVARKSREVPALKEEIKNGNISVSKAKKLSPVINKRNQNYWIKLAKNETSRKIEKQVAAASPRHAVRDQLQYVGTEKEITEKTKIISLAELPDSAKEELNMAPSPTRVQLQVGVSEEIMLKLRRVQDLLSQKRRKPVGLEDCLEVMTEMYIQKLDPVEKAKRQKIKGRLQNQSEIGLKTQRETAMAKGGKQNGNLQRHKLVTGPVNVDTASGRKPIPAKTKHHLYLKYNGRCGFRDTSGERCRQKRFLEIHHIRPVSKGGSNKLENLILICSGHHKVVHDSTSVTPI